MFDASGQGVVENGGEAGGEAGGDATHVGRHWREIDRRMRRLAARRAALDVEEARMLVVAKRAEIHRHLGYGSFAEYIERVLGYAPNTGRDRVRVAEELEHLPAIAEAWERGQVSYSVVREITRIATPENEETLLAYVDGLTVREVEQAMRGRKKGDDPNDRPDPDLEPRIVRMELPPAAYALFLDARRHLEKVTGQMMSDAEFISVACRAVLGGTAADGEAPPNVPPHQVAIVVCDDCKRGWHDVRGRSVELSPAAIERARCDAVELGRVDDCEKPRRKTWTISPRTRKAVLARDRHRCTVPGCTSSAFVDVHHIRHRAHGGDDRMRNLTTLCELHHTHHHEGMIKIEGEGGAIRVTHADGRSYGAPPAGVRPMSARDGDARPDGAAHVGDSAREPSG